MDINFAKLRSPPPPHHSLLYPVPLTGKSLRTATRVRVHAIDTGAAVLTRVGLTVVDVDLAEVSIKAVLTHAQRLLPGLEAQGSVETGVGVAGVLRLAQRPRELQGALAGERPLVQVRHTGTAVHARVVEQTRVKQDFAQRS